jgi:hypothetical protein
MSQAKESHFLALICRIHNEHFMMKTFVPYYLSQGVDMIYLIDDASTKPYDEIINNPKVKFITSPLKRNPDQMGEATKLYSEIKNTYEWVIFIDADEFIYTKGEDTTIRSMLLNEFKDADCLYVPWVFFSFNNRQFDGNDIIDDYTFRWNHDKKHPHPNNDHKNRCRYDNIESKTIFKSSKFKSMINPHFPSYPIGSNINYRESVNNTPHTNMMFNNFREKDIKNGLMLCNHYRFSSIDKIKQKCNINSFNMYKNISVENCILSDYPEVLDETLKIKWNGLKKQIKSLN